MTVFSEFYNNDDGLLLTELIFPARIHRRCVPFSKGRKFNVFMVQRQNLFLIKRIQTASACASVESTNKQNTGIYRSVYQHTSLYMLQ